ncbi:Ber1p [Sporobolomyces koalae]|uniref:Ber1p n=1 Tax=Sporobolomyces koalae TaxID=500713 RepID=UPI00317EB9E6
MSAETAAAEDDGFTSVTYKKPTRAPKNRKGKNRYRERTLDEKLAAREDALTRSGYVQNCRQLLRDALAHSTPEPDSSVPSTSACPPPRSVVCLGLGSVSESTKAQDQYLLLKGLLLELGAEVDQEEPVTFYDPVFSPEDASFLTQQGHKVLSSEFPLELEKPTLLYIPHGPRFLFNSLIEQNWSATQLSKMIIFGNRLDLYEDPTYSGTTVQSAGELGELEGGMRWIRRAAPLFNIVPLPKTKDHLEAFNDLALEWVDMAKIDEAVRSGELPEGTSHETTVEEPRETNGREQEPNVELDESIQAMQRLELSSAETNIKNQD